MYIYDLTDIIFFIKSIKFPSEKWNLAQAIPDQQVYKIEAPTNNMMNSYFYRLPRLWNSIATNNPIPYQLSNLN